MEGYKVLQPADRGIDAGQSRATAHPYSLRSTGRPAVPGSPAPPGSPVFWPNLLELLTPILPPLPGAEEPDLSLVRAGACRKLWGRKGPNGSAALGPALDARQLGLTRTHGDTGWAWITPCHWQINADHVAMDHPGSLALDVHEIGTPCGLAMQPYFAEDGITRHASEPQHLAGPGRAAARAGPRPRSPGPAAQRVDSTDAPRPPGPQPAPPAKRNADAARPPPGERRASGPAAAHGQLLLGSAAPARRPRVPWKSPDTMSVQHSLEAAALRDERSRPGHKPGKRWMLLRLQPGCARPSGGDLRHDAAPA